MSEYQYYAFQAIDRPLDKAAQMDLRDLSSRARITATSFTNSWQGGDFKGDLDAPMPVAWPAASSRPSRGPRGRRDRAARIPPRAGTNPRGILLGPSWR